MSLAEYYKKYDKAIWSLGFAIIILAAGFIWGYEVGYPAGMNDVPEPEYQISSYSMRMNATYYNYTYYQLTRNDMKSDLWSLVVEPRDNYFMVGISINAKSDNWSSFFVGIQPLVLGPNITIELISIQTYYYEQFSHNVNFYGGAYGGTTCRDIAQIYFLGYGDVDIEGIDIAVSGLISIRGRFG